MGCLDAPTDRQVLLRTALFDMVALFKPLMMEEKQQNETPVRATHEGMQEGAQKVYYRILTWRHSYRHSTRNVKIFRGALEERPEEIDKARSEACSSSITNHQREHICDDATLIETSESRRLRGKESPPPERKSQQDFYKRFLSLNTAERVRTEVLVNETVV